jgi:myosin protein heavy chain
VAEIQKDMATEREASGALQQQKAALEKSLNEAQLKLVDLETKGYSSTSQDIKFLHKRIQEVSQARPAAEPDHVLTFAQLESQLEEQESERSKSQRSERNVDRIVKDLQTQIDRKDKQNSQLADDVGRMRDKVDKLLQTIEELQSSESANQLTARRAERELREEKEKALRLERELEGWKSLRVEKGSNTAVGSIRSRMGPWRASDGDDASVVDVPRRKSSLSRVPSLTKGFI